MWFEYRATRSASRSAGLRRGRARAGPPEAIATPGPFCRANSRQTALRVCASREKASSGSRYPIFPGPAVVRSPPPIRRCSPRDRTAADRRKWAGDPARPIAGAVRKRAPGIAPSKCTCPLGRVPNGTRRLRKTPAPLESPASLSPPGKEAPRIGGGRSRRAKDRYPHREPAPTPRRRGPVPR